MTTPAHQEPAFADAYGQWLGSVYSVCQRCAAMVLPSDEARQLHTEFHARLDRQAERREQSE